METNPIIRFRETPTRKRAIIAMCCQCMGCVDEALEPGFRRMISECTSTKCALHSFRPFQKGDKEDADDIPWTPPAGWLAHPTAPGYYYCGTDVKTEQQLREMTL